MINIYDKHLIFERWCCVSRCARWNREDIFIKLAAGHSAKSPRYRTFCCLFRHRSHSFIRRTNCTFRIQASIGFISHRWTNVQHFQRHRSSTCASRVQTHRVGWSYYEPSVWFSVLTDDIYWTKKFLFVLYLSFNYSRFKNKE